jgi:hypothetical protein
MQPKLLRGPHISKRWSLGEKKKEKARKLSKRQKAEDPKTLETKGSLEDSKSGCITWRTYIYENF